MKVLFSIFELNFIGSPKLNGVGLEARYYYITHIHTYTHKEANIVKEKGGTS